MLTNLEKMLNSKLRVFLCSFHSPLHLQTYSLTQILASNVQKHLWLFGNFRFSNNIIYLEKKKTVTDRLRSFGSFRQFQTFLRSVSTLSILNKRTKDGIFKT